MQSSFLLSPLLNLFFFCEALGGLFQILNCLDVIPHGPHFQIIKVFLSGQLFGLGPPRLGGNLLAGCFQRVQVAGGGIEQGKVGTVLLLKLFFPGEILSSFWRMGLYF